MTKCDFCVHASSDPKNHKEALYDGRTRLGYWAFMCLTHFKHYGVGLGVGCGQELKKVKL